MDRCLTELLLEQVRLGRKVENGFDKDAWAAVVPSLNARCGSRLTKEHCKNRLRTWKKIYRGLKTLLGQNGFVWDEEHKMVYADDHVWDDYIKAYPYAKQYRTKIVPNYNEMALIIDNVMVDGNRSRLGLAMKAEDNALESEDEDSVDPGTSADIERGVDDMHDSDFSGEDIDSSPQGARPQSATPLGPRQPNNQKKSPVETIAESLAEMANAIKLLVSGREANKAKRMKTLYNEVKRIPKISNHLLFEACNLLAADENKAMLFLAIDEELRYEWLLMQLKRG